MPRDQIRSHCTIRNPTDLDRMILPFLPLHDARDAQILLRSELRPIDLRRQLQPEKETVKTVKCLDTMQTV